MSRFKPVDADMSQLHASFILGMARVVAVFPGFLKIFVHFVFFFFFLEIDFWNSRLCNLEYIYEQLRDERVRKMAIILEKTDSAYYPCFRTQFQNIVAGQQI